MYLEYLINESAVREDIETNEAEVLKTFKDTFSIEKVYKQVEENLHSLLSQDNILQTYDNIKSFSKNHTLNYLVSTSKQLSA